MAHYRAYIIGNDGRVVKAIDLLQDNDEMAGQAAKRLVERHDVEVWQRERKVAAFKSHPANASALQTLREYSSEVRT